MLIPPQLHRGQCFLRMADGDENFLSREEDKEEKFGLRGETKIGREARLVFSLVHGYTVDHTAVTLKRLNLKPSPFPIRKERP